MSYFVILRGPLGVGKTTVARRLAERLGASVVSIDRLLEVHDLEQWEDGYISRASFLRANALAAAEAGPSLAEGRPVLFEGNFYYPEQIDDLIDRLASRPFVFTLKAPVATCIERDAHRERPLGEQGAREVHAKVTAFDRGIGIEATRPLEEVVAEIQRHLPAVGGRG